MNTFSLLINIDHGSLIETTVTISVIVVSLCISILSINADRKIQRINRELTYREELFQSLGSNIDDVFIIYDSSNEKIEYISPNFEQSLGLDRDILINDYLRLLNYVPLKERQSIIRIIKSSALLETKQIEFEYDPAETGEKRWLSVCIYPAFNNNILRYVICIADITKEKEDQRLIREALETVEKANEAKKEFLSHMSHEIKTPICAVIGMTQIAKNAIEDKEKVISCLSKIEFASDRLLEMINNILDMSKIDSHKLELIQEPFSLYEIATQFSSIMGNQAELQKIEFTLFFHNVQEFNLIGDSMRLYQILDNCVSNSLKFTPPGGKIRLEVSETGKSDDIVTIHFVISDTGKGMCEDFLRRIFIPFDQEDSSIAKTYGGTGLGMPIARNLVLLMGGSIDVASKKNIGTTITIDIPFKINSLPKQSADYTFPISEKKPGCSGKRVLVVEDNEINREITCEFLKYLQINVEAATNGREALRIFEASKSSYYDAILMDIKMSDYDGYETTAAIRNSSHPDAAKICIIAMTADNFADEDKSMDSGMNYHITKPIDLDYFCSLIHNVMDQNK